MDAKLYDGERLIATGPCVLSSGAAPVTGSMVIGQAGNLLNNHFLSLRLEGGQELEITPVRIEHTAGGPAVLLFEVTP